MEQQRDWRRGMQRNEQYLAGIRGRAILADNAAAAAQTPEEKAAAEQEAESAWVRYRAITSSRQIWGELNHARQLDLITRDKLPEGFVGPYEYSPAVLEKIRARLRRERREDDPVAPMRVLAAHAPAEVFHTMEKFFAIFPHNGKNVSTVWKTFPDPRPLNPEPCSLIPNMQPKEVQAKQLKHHWEIYFFIVPTLILIALFQYYPASSGIFHSLFRWNGSDISEFVGLENYTDLLKNLEFWNSFKLAFILGFWNVIKMIPALLVAVCIHRASSDKMQFFYRTLFVVPMVIPGLITVLIWRSFFFEATAGYLNQFLDWTGLMTLLQHAGAFVAAKLADPCRTRRSLARSFFESFDWLTAFKAGTAPAWLGDPKIIIIACVVWGFPWVGSFAVLTHLAKLQNISKDIYEAADIDGANWWSRFTKIELPLLMGSIYLLMVFAIIDTIKDAGMILALAGITGGPGGKATVPALFMLRKAFMDQQMGYACAVGIVLTVVVLLLQKICNMLLQEQPEGGSQPGKSTWFGILSLYAFVEGFLFFRAHLAAQDRHARDLRRLRRPPGPEAGPAPLRPRPPAQIRRPTSPRRPTAASATNRPIPPSPPASGPRSSA